MYQPLRVKSENFNYNFNIRTGMENLKPIVIIPVHITSEHLFKLTILSLQYLNSAVIYSGKDVNVYLSGFVDGIFKIKCMQYIDSINNSNNLIKITAHYREKPYGFSENVNYILNKVSKSDYDYMLTMNNDLLVPEFLFRSMEKAFTRGDAIGIVSNFAMGIQQVNVDSYGLIDKEIVLNNDSFNIACRKWQSEYKNEYEKTPVLTFLCVALKKDVIDTVGILDERFKIGICEDLDYSIRILQAGYKSLVNRECFCFHFGSQTFNDKGIKVDELTALNKLRLYDKYDISTIPEIENILGITELDYIYDLYRTPEETDKFDNSHILEHLHTLKILASSVDHITELGTRNGISTIAFLAARPKVLRSYDINEFAAYETAKTLISNTTDFTFTQADDLTITLEPTELLFIDTLHTYDQIKQELKLHGNVSSKYMVFHDTVTFGVNGELPDTVGIMAAITEFIDDNKHWKIKRHRINNNGLLILERVNDNTL